MTTPTPPGWYSDPRDPRVEHWWDGQAYVQSRPAGTPAPAAPTAYGAAPAAVVAGRVVFVSPKSRTVAVILGFFFGFLGIDRFYLGNIGMGVAKLLLGWLTLGIWPLVDWIIILAGAAHDGNGQPVTNWG